MPTAVEVIEEITIDGRPIRVRIDDLPLDDVKLDPRNPRLASMPTSPVPASGPATDPASQEKLEEFLWTDDGAHDRCRKIYADKGQIERVIVRHDGTIAEGNGRLLAYRRLRQEHPEEATWRAIPARLLPDGLSERDVVVVLAELHVASKNTWSPFEKAAHVHRMREEFAFTEEEIAARLRIPVESVSQSIRAVGIMRSKFLLRYPRWENLKRFSFFEELYKTPDLRDWIANPNAEDLFVDWVGEGKLPDGFARDLAQIVADERAVKALSADSFEAARHLGAKKLP